MACQGTTWAGSRRGSRVQAVACECTSLLKAQRAWGRALGKVRRVGMVGIVASVRAGGGGGRRSQEARKLGG